MTRSKPQSALLFQLRESLASSLPDFLANRRWFGGKARTLRSVEVLDVVPLMTSPRESFLIVAHIAYASGPDETYSVPLILKSPDTPVQAGAPFLAARVADEPEEYVLYDAMLDESFLAFLLEAIAQRKSFAGLKGKVTAVPTAALSALWQPGQERLKPAVMNVEQSNTSAVFGKRLVLKIFRRLQEGINPDVEIGAFLTADSRFSHSPAVAGYMEYTAGNAKPGSLGILQAYVPNQGDAWTLTLKALADYYAQAADSPIQEDEIQQGRLFVLADQPVPPQAQERIGAYLKLARLLAQRTAELHLALSSAPENSAFSPESFGDADLRFFCNSALELLKNTFELLHEKQSTLPINAQELAARVLASETNAAHRFRLLLELNITALRTRIHGDYHLGQVLFTGEDFMIIDFEGEPARSLSERRAKRSPLQDVAGMLRSFHYAAYAPLLGGPSGRDDLPRLQQYARYWQAWVSATFLRTYQDICGNARHIPRSQVEFETLLDVYLLDKAIYELRYELNNRPLWAAIPLEGIAHLLT